MLFFYGLFPDCFIEGKGLTPFKIASEYIISFILVLSVLYLRKRREFFEKPVLNLLIGSIIITIASELAFTLYRDVYGFFTLLGHYFKIVSFYLIYAAIIKTNLRKPYESLVNEIDDRKQAEEELREKTAEVDSYFNNALDLFCIADTDGYFRRLNKEWESTLGYSLAELEGKRFLDFVHPEDMDATLKATSQLDTQENVLNFTNRYRCKDGSYRWIEWRSTSSGKLIYAAARDITERKQAEEKILKLNRVYAVISALHFINKSFMISS
ncbi:MAG: MASE3 domain-containing protein [Pseudomonadota bacterium]